MSETRQILVGGVRVGLVGLDEAFATVQGETVGSNDELADRLVEIVAGKNYIAPSHRDHYKAALLKEYRKARGEAVPEEKGALEIRVLGPGCPNCDRLMTSVMDVLTGLGLIADVDHVRDPAQIGRLGPVPTPALMVNGRIVAQGRVPSRRDLESILKEAAK